MDSRLEQELGLASLREPVPPAQVWWQHRMDRQHLELEPQELALQEPQAQAWLEPEQRRQRIIGSWSSRGRGCWSCWPEQESRHRMDHPSSPPSEPLVSQGQGLPVQERTKGIASRGRGRGGRCWCSRRWLIKRISTRGWGSGRHRGRRCWSRCCGCCSPKRIVSSWSWCRWGRCGRSRVCWSGGCSCRSSGPKRVIGCRGRSGWGRRRRGRAKRIVYRSLGRFRCRRLRDLRRARRSERIIGLTRRRSARDLIRCLGHHLGRSWGGRRSRRGSTKWIIGSGRWGGRSRSCWNRSCGCRPKRIISGRARCGRQVLQVPELLEHQMDPLPPGLLEPALLVQLVLPPEPRQMGRLLQERLALPVLELQEFQQLELGSLGHQMDPWLLGQPE